MEAAIQFEKVSFSYGKDSMFSNTSIDFRSGIVSVMLGRNGSGKSTLIRLAAGLLKPVSGNIRVKGKILQQITQFERSRLLGFLPQSHHAVFPFTVKDVVLTGRAGQTGLIPGKNDREKTHEAIEYTGISHLAEKPYTSLSGGEQQLVMLARVLAQDPEIILLDEPTSHLDLSRSEQLFALLKKLSREGKAILMVLHDPIAALAWGDHFICISNDFQIEEMEAESITPVFLEKLYGLPFEEVGGDPKKILRIKRK